MKSELQLRRELIKKMKKEEKILCESRDRLLEFQGELEDLGSNCEDAKDSLRYAIEALSRLV